MGPTLRGWTHLVGAAGLFLILAERIPTVLVVLGWIAIIFYALAWWAFLDEWLKARRRVEENSVMVQNPGPSPAPPVAFVLLLVGLVALFFKPSAGIGLMALGLLILFVGYKLQGGAANPNLYRDSEDVHREWMSVHASPGSSERPNDFVVMKFLDGWLSAGGGPDADAADVLRREWPSLSPQEASAMVAAWKTTIPYRRPR